jgi:hypothetical protein
MQDYFSQWKMVCHDTNNQEMAVKFFLQRGGKYIKRSAMDAWVLYTARQSNKR